MLREPRHGGRLFAVTLLRFLPACALALAFSGCGDDTPTGPLVAPVVDQAFEPGAATALVGIGNVGAYTQTFTAAQTGTLTSIDLILSAQGTDDTIRVDIRGTTAGFPNLDDGVVLGSRLVAAADLPSVPERKFVTIDFIHQGIPCSAGQRLAIVVIRVAGSGPADVLWITENQAGEEYAAGTAMQRNGGNGTGWTPFASDFYFRTHVLVH
jgi:hypothetical protein